MNDTGTKTFGEAIRHRFALLLLVVALFGVAGWYAARNTTPTYQASSQVYIDVSASHQNNVNPGDGLLNSYWVQQATAGTVLQNAAAKLGHGETAQTLQPTVHASVLKSTNIVQITADAWNPQQAASRANAVAQALVEQNRADALARSADQEQVINNRINQLNSQVESTQDALKANQAQLPLTALASNQQQAQQQTLQSQLNLLLGQLSEAQNQLQQLHVTTADQANQVRLNQLAAPPLKPAAPDPRLYIGGGLLVGLIVGVLLALLLERFDDRVLETAPLGRAAGTSLVVAMPASWRRRGSERNLYTLALAHLFARHPNATRILAVAALPDQTATRAAEQLGAAAAALGRRAQVLGAGEEPAVDEAAADHELTGEAAGGYISHPTVSLPPAIRVRPRTDIAEDSTRDVTITATPSPMSSPAALTAGRGADVAVLVVTAGRTRLSQVRQAADALRAAGLDIGGAILIPRSTAWRRWIRGAFGGSP